MADKTIPVLKVLRGNVGIGMNAPLAPIDLQYIYNSAYTSANSNTANPQSVGFRIHNNTATASSSASLLFMVGNSSSGRASINCVWRGSALSDLAFGSGTTGGAVNEGMRLTSEGNLGIGTTAPGHPLVVVGSADKGISLLNDSYTEVLHMRQEAGDSAMVIFKDGGSNKIMLTSRPNNHSWFNVSGGNVGIGTDSSITSKLKVEASTDGDKLSLENTSTGGRAFWTWVEGASYGVTQQMYDNTNTLKVFIRSYGDSYFTGGNFGIGTAVPGNFHSSGNRLVIGDGSGEQGMTIYSSSTTGGVINFADIATTGSYQGRIIYNHSTNDMTFHGGGGGAERVRIKSDGNVGIGTASPGSVLQIHATRTSSTNVAALILSDNVTGTQTNGVYKAIRSISNGANSVSEIRFMETDGTNNNTSIAFATAAVAGGLTERMRVNQSGSVGIGTTAPATTLDVNGVTTARDYIRLGASAVHGSLTWLSSSPARLILFGASGRKLSLGSNGAYDKVTLDLNGNVGIGDTTPNYKLDVNGTFRVTGAATFDSSIGFATVLAGNGTASLPSFAFTNDPNTGMYNDGANDNLKFSTGGVVRAFLTATQWNVTGNIVGVAGIFSGAVSGTTGTFTGNVAVSHGSAPHFQIQQTSGNAWRWYTDGTDSYIRNGTGGWNVAKFAANADVGFYNPDGSATQFFWDSSAEKLGIGTSSPSESLHIYRGSGPEIRLQNSTRNWYLRSYGDRLDIYITGTSLQAFTILADGKIGIGATVPAVKLHLDSGATTELRIDGEAHELITFHKSSAQKGLVGYSNSDSTLKLCAGSGTIASNVNGISINANGNVGIGTATPGGILSIGSSNESYFSSTAANTLNFFYNENSDTGGWINYRGYQDGTTQTRDLIIGDGKGAKIATFDGSTKRLGIGTDAPSRLFNVYSGSDDTAWIRASYGTTTMCEIGAHSAAAYLQSGSGDDIRIAPAGGTKLIVKVDGKIGIGTTAPDEKLEIYDGYLKITDAVPTMVFERQSDALKGYITSNVGYFQFSYNTKDGDGYIKMDVNTSGGSAITHEGNGYLRLGANSVSNQLVLAANGKVGIGTGTPTATLHVSDSGTTDADGYSLAKSDADAQSLRTYHNGTNWVIAPKYGTQGGLSDLHLQASTGNTAGLLINRSTGNVGIGTTTPEATLTLAGPSGTHAIFRTNEATASQRAGGGFSSAGNATAASRYARMFLDADGGDFSGVDYFTIEKFGGGHDNPGGEVKLINYSDSNMSFWVNTSVRAMTIEEGGQIGIGTAAPSAKLDVRSPLVSQHAIYAESNTAYGCPLYLNDLRSDASMEHFIRLERNTTVVGDLASDATNLRLRSVTGYMILDGANGTILRDSGSNKIIQNGSYFRPDSNNNMYLGSTGERWAQVYSVLGNFTGTVTSTSTSTQIEVWGATSGTQVHFRAATAGANRTQLQLKSINQIGTLELYNAQNVAWTVLSGNGHSYFNGGHVGIGTASPEVQLTVRQSAQDSGIRLYGHSAYAGSYMNFRVDSGGHTNLETSGGSYTKFDIGSGYFLLTTAANEPIYMDFGGSFYWRDRDASNAVRMSLNSANGALTLNGTLTGTSAAFSHTVDPGTTPTALSVVLPGVSAGTVTNQYAIKVHALGYNNSSNVYGVHSTTPQQNISPAYAYYGETSGVYGDVYGIYTRATQSNLNGGCTAYAVYGSATSTVSSYTVGKTYGGYFTNTSSVGAAAVGLYVSSSYGDPLIVNTGATQRFKITNNGSLTGAATLSAATGNEVAYNLSYTTNKATSGDDTGLLVAMTNTASPGTSLLLDLQVTNGGGTKFKVDAGGNVTPAGYVIAGDTVRGSRMQATSYGSTTLPAFAFGGQTNYGFYRSGNDIRLCMNGVDKVTVLQNGNVGIGTINPGTPFHVYDNDSTQSIWKFQNYGTGMSQLSVYQGSGSLYLSLNRTDTYGSISMATQPFYIKHYHGSWVDTFSINTSGQVGINDSNASYQLDVNGTFRATGDGYFDQDLSVAAHFSVSGTKNFVIDHPTKEGMKLVHSCIEGPEAAVYYRGRVQSDTITLPDYWSGLVRDGTITVQLTPNGSFQHLYVVSTSLSEIKIGAADGETIDCYYVIYGERADVAPLVVEDAAAWERFQERKSAMSDGKA